MCYRLHMAEFQFSQAPVSPKALKAQKPPARSQIKSEFIVNQIAHAIDPDAWKPTPGLSRQALEKMLTEAMQRIAILEGKPIPTSDLIEWDDLIVQRRRTAALAKANALFEVCQKFIRTQEIRRSFVMRRK